MLAELHVLNDGLLAVCERRKKHFCWWCRGCLGWPADRARTLALLIVAHAVFLCLESDWSTLLAAQATGLNLVGFESAGNTHLSTWTTIPTTNLTAHSHLVLCQNDTEAVVFAVLAHLPD